MTTSELIEFLKTAEMKQLDDALVPFIVKRITPSGYGHYHTMEPTSKGVWVNDDFLTYDELAQGEWEWSVL